MARERRFVTDEQVQRARAEQQQLADRGVERSLFLLLLDLELLSDAQARELRRHTSSTTLRALEVDGYVFQGRIGSGGMGDVYRARNATGHEAAVKLLAQKYATNPENLHRFTREARAGMRLDHAHIVHSLGSGEVGGTRYLLMELIAGPSLKARITEAGKLGEEDALTVLAQMSDALGYAWQHGVLHRDVKPANIVLGPARPGISEPFCAKLCDFGLAKVLAVGDGSGAHDSIGQLTGEGLALGTPHYMSPEQASGAMDLDQAADIYGLGATLYHGLLGHTMFTGKSSAVIMYKQVTEDVDLSQLTADRASPGLRALLERMLAKDRRQRINDWADIHAQAVALLAKRRSQRLPAIAPASAPIATPTTRAIHPAIAAASAELPAPAFSQTPARPWWRQLAAVFGRDRS